MAFKIAYGAGHNDKVSNGIPESLHKPFMNEWRLNDRIARYFAEAAQQYEDVQLLRVDDPKGQKATVLAERCRDANNWGANFFLSIHHNAGINGGSGGGLVAFSYKEGTTAAKYRDAIYNYCMAAGGIKGNRSDATLTANFYVLKNTNMPAVLMEYGFMDSTTDVPIILDETFAKKQAYATMDGIAKVAGLHKKSTVEKDYDNEYMLAFRVLSEGDEGSDVKALQTLIAGAGVYCAVDGIFGPQTDKAVKQYKKKNGLAANGVVDASTMRALLGL